MLIHEGLGEALPENEAQAIISPRDEPPVDPDRLREITAIIAMTTVTVEPQDREKMTPDMIAQFAAEVEREHPGVLKSILNSLRRRFLSVL